MAEQNRIGGVVLSGHSFGAFGNIALCVLERRFFAAASGCHEGEGLDEKDRKGIVVGMLPMVRRSRSARVG